MPTHRMLNAFGSWALVILGAGHLVTSQLTPVSAPLGRVISSMERLPVAMLGRTGNLYEYHVGFSLMMGILLIGYGALALAAFRGRAADHHADRPALATSALVSAVAVVASVKFFFAVPVVMTSVALLAYAIALVLTYAERTGASADRPTAAAIAPPEMSHHGSGNDEAVAVGEDEVAFAWSLSLRQSHAAMTVGAAVAALLFASYGWHIVALVLGVSSVMAGVVTRWIIRTPYVHSGRDGLVVRRSMLRTPALVTWDNVRHARVSVKKVEFPTRAGREVFVRLSAVAEEDRPALVALLAARSA